jgi:hypothetical protein
VPSARRAACARDETRNYGSEPEACCLGPAERKHRGAGSSEQQILLLARGEAGARPVTATLSGLVLSTRWPGRGRGCGSCPSWRTPATVRSPTGQAFRRCSTAAAFTGDAVLSIPRLLRGSAARAGSDSRLQPVKHEPHGPGATLSLAFRRGSRSQSLAVLRDWLIAPIAEACSIRATSPVRRRRGSLGDRATGCCWSSVGTRSSAPPSLLLRAIARPLAGSRQATALRGLWRLGPAIRSGFGTAASSMSSPGR